MQLKRTDETLLIKNLAYSPEYTVKSVHPSNAQASITALVGIVKLSKFTQPEKLHAPIRVTVSGIITLFRLAQF